jgi:hypothetical protein
MEASGFVNVLQMRIIQRRRRAGHREKQTRRGRGMRKEDG